MAATLIELKTRMLLPRESVCMLRRGRRSAPRIGRSIARVSEIQSCGANALVARRSSALCLSGEIETDKNNPEVACLFDLLKVFQEILARHKEEVLMEIEREEIPWRRCLNGCEYGDVQAEVNLRVFFEQARSRRELVVAFFPFWNGAHYRCDVNSEQTFGDIVVKLRRE
jgi:chromatin segregation and condensation protein Rec8/ScpA/Scc1 (kleisin family)